MSTGRPCSSNPSAKRAYRSSRVSLLVGLFLLSLLVIHLYWQPTSTRTVLRSAAIRRTSVKTPSLNIQPLPRNKKFTERPTSHLQLVNQTVHVSDHLPDISLVYLQGSSLELKEQEQSLQNMHALSLYVGGFEGSITYTWMSILRTLLAGDGKDDMMVIDGGMNIGFFTLLSAAMGVKHIHSFDIQLDCFDLSSMLLEANNVFDKEGEVNLYHVGLWNNNTMNVTVLEGCDPGNSLAHGIAPANNKNTTWTRRVHSVPTISLGSFLQDHNQNDVSILKLDLEGAEIGALQGITDSQLARIHNIITEFSPHYTKRMGTALDEAKAQLSRLAGSNFDPYLLFAPVPQEHWFNATYLNSIGLETVVSHPITLQQPKAVTEILWKIFDWDGIFKADVGPCRIACNIWFHRRGDEASSKVSV
jgi:FkbM family methyltransferase